MQHAGAGAYRPKKYKKQRRVRGPEKQKARMNYRRNRGILKQKARRRYNQVRKNPAFKRKKTVYRKNRQKFRRLAMDMQHEPAIYFMMHCKGAVQPGYITSITAEDWDIGYELEDGTQDSVSVDEFFDCAVLFDEEDIEQIFNVLDQASEIEDDGDEDVTVWDFTLDDVTPGQPMMASRIAMRHVVALNKENPSDLLNQLVKVLDKAVQQAEGRGKKTLQDAKSRVKGITKIVADAWLARKDD